MLRNQQVTWVRRWLCIGWWMCWARPSFGLEPHAAGRAPLGAPDSAGHLLTQVTLTPMRVLVFASDINVPRLKLDLTVDCSVSVYLCRWLSCVSVCGFGEMLLLSGRVRTKPPVDCREYRPRLSDPRAQPRTPVCAGARTTKLPSQPRFTLLLPSHLHPSLRNVIIYYLLH